MKLIPFLMILLCVMPSNAAEEKRELLSKHETIAKFEGLKFQPCRHLTSLCPNNCTHAGQVAAFKIIEYITYEKPGKYGDPKSKTYQVMVEDQLKNPTVPDVILNKILALKEGDIVKLSWNHDYVTKNKSSSPERPIVKLAKVDEKFALAAGAVDISAIVEPGTQVKLLGTGMKFTEGPVWIPAEKKVIFSDIPNSMLMQWSEKEGLKPFRKVEQSNGNLLDADGRLLTCQHAGRNIVRTEKDGGVTVLVDKYEGKKFNSPNDLARHSDGSIWFTDPSYGLRGKPGEIPGKWVFRFDLNTKRVGVIYKGFDMPNGIAFSPDERHVYIADTGKVAKVRAFKVAGEAIDQQPVFEIDIRCDGMCVDTQGNIYTTSTGGIHVFNKEGKKIGLIEVPEKPANVCFGGENFDTLYITARKSLYRIKTKMKGALPPS